MQLSRSGNAGAAQSLSPRQGLEEKVSWVQVEGLCHQIKEVQGEVSRLHSIRDDQKEIFQIFSKTMWLQEPECPAVLKEGQSLCFPGWEMMTKAGNLCFQVPTEERWCPGIR